jgi:hypothetical protein
LRIDRSRTIDQCPITTLGSRLRGNDEEEITAILETVVPAKAGTQCRCAFNVGSTTLDSRLRGNDGIERV